MDDQQVSEPVRRRAADLARQPSLWPAPPARPPRRPSRLRQAWVVVRTAVAAAVLLGGPPWLLWQGFGNPVTVASSWWATGPFSATGTAEGLRVAGIWAAWVSWAVLATLLAGSVVGVLRGRRLPRWRLPIRLHRLVFGLTGTATVALVSTPVTAAVASTPAQAAPAPDAIQIPPGVPPPRAATTAPATADATEPSFTAGHSGLATVAVGDVRYDYRVRRGDTLSKVARAWLGDPDRWPDICRLNKHRHFAGGRTLTDCDLIHPGWELRMPADAVPPPGATPARPPRNPSRPAPPPRPGPSDPSPPLASPTAVPPNSTAVAPPVGFAEATPPASTGPDDDQDDDAGGGLDAGADLVLPAGSIIPWALAAAITTTAAMVWIQRRRRWRPGRSYDPSQDRDLQPLPTAVRTAQRHVRHTPAPTDTPGPADPVAGLALPSGGVGLVGPGADAAARGMIITALTTGRPQEPASRAEVIIDRPTLTALVGDIPIIGWPRLHITDSLDQALTLIDTHLLHRARTLDDEQPAHDTGTRDTVPNDRGLPPLLLITQTEQASATNRARITFGLTHGLNVTTVILGHWAHGPTISVTQDGDARPEPGTTTGTGTLAVLDVATTHNLLTTVREAHTGEPPPPHTPARTPPASTLPELGPAPAIGLAPAAAPRSPARSDHDDAAPPVPAVAKRARLRVLGPPRIEDITTDGRPLRAKALELAVFLAVHPDGVSTRDIGEYLEPDARISQADQRVHTNASNLRHVLGRAGTADTKNGYVIKSAGRYLLDPATVDVDLWTLRSLMNSATIAANPHRRDLLAAACDLCTGPLADGKDYDWLQPHRETVRRWTTEAHLMLADDLLDTDPQKASDVLDTAIGLDRYNETLYTTAMRARHALGDADGIRTLLRAVTKALADLDAEPHDDTTALADQLRSQLDDK